MARAKKASPTPQDPEPQPLTAGQYSSTTGGYVGITPAAPCPTCGTCPTCGRAKPQGYTPWYGNVWYGNNAAAGQNFMYTVTYV